MAGQACNKQAFESPNTLGYNEIRTNAVIDEEAPFILIVDDDPTNVHFLSHILTKSGYKVGKAASGDEALAFVEHTIPDLILLDVRMPEMDGFEVCRRLKTNDRTAGVPVMFLTAEGRNDENVSAGFGAGAIDYITKPFSRVDVLARIQLNIQQRDKEASYRKMANKDPLTELDNRRALDERLTTLLSEGRRHDRPVTVMMIDLDRFKDLNDSYGHDFGDQVLVGFAQLLRSQYRLEDVVCRFGGEEFVVVMSNTDLDKAVQAAERTRRALAQTAFRTPQDQQVHTTASFGLVCTHPGGGPWDRDDLLHRADEALYAAKRGGRNRLVRFDQMPTVSADASTAASTGNANE